MNVPAPMFITARLEAGIHVGDGGTVSVWHEGGDYFGYRIENAEGVELEEGSELRCACFGDYSDPMRALLGFLGAAGEAYGYDMHRREEGAPPSVLRSLFSPEVMQWAYQYSDEIAMAECWLEKEDE